MHGHQINPTGPANALLFILLGNEKERGDRHEFPAYQKQHAIPRHNH